jgi:hypothetical protein
VFSFNVRVDVEHPIPLRGCGTTDAKTWKQEYDSAWYPTGAVNSAGEGKEENGVKDPRKIKIVRPIAGHTGKLLEAGYDIVMDRIIKK